jgi:hypothetical protein
MSSTAVVSFTDDEVVALSAAKRSPWRGVLPTIDMDSSDGVAAALLRGVRSLALRGVLPSGQGTEEGVVSLEALVGLIGARPVARVMAVNAELEVPRGAAIVEVFSVNGTTSLVTTSALGVHEVVSFMDITPSDAVIQIVRELPLGEVATGSATLFRDHSEGLTGVLVSDCLTRLDVKVTGEMANVTLAEEIADLGDFLREHLSA